MKCKIISYVTRDLIVTIQDIRKN